MKRDKDLAFPGTVSWGMTLRQYYAGLAMQGLLSLENLQNYSTPADVAKLSVTYSDALIAELNKTTQP